MDFKILAVGDVVGDPGMNRIRRSLRYLKRKTQADFVVVNGENAAVVGMTPQQAEEILDAGADVITMGNHTFGIWRTAGKSSAPPTWPPRPRAVALPFSTQRQARLPLSTSLAAAIWTMARITPS